MLMICEVKSVGIHFNRLWLWYNTQNRAYLYANLRLEQNV
jgi:hypothetical protein